MKKLIKSIWKKKRSKFRLTLSVLALGVLVLAMGAGTASANPGGPWYVNASTGDDVLTGLAVTWTDTNGNEADRKSVV